jgi:hypothetical protein
VHLETILHNNFIICSVNEVQLGMDSELVLCQPHCLDSIMRQIVVSCKRRSLFYDVVYCYVIFRCSLCNFEGNSLHY